MPGILHHVPQRGNRCQTTFFSGDDYREYRILLNRYSVEAGLEIWAYCLMPSYVHLVVVPSDEHSLRSAPAEAHRRYSRRINFRNAWRGYLWQGRFASFPLDDRHLFAAVRYVELNPGRAGLVDRVEAWP
jgi:putative transposase